MKTVSAERESVAKPIFSNGYTEQDTKTNTDNANREYVSVLDIDLSESVKQSYKNTINSPRTLEAMANIGIMSEEFDDMSYDQIKKQLMIRERKQNIPSMIVDLRYDNFQKKRQAKRQLVVDERQRLIDEETKCNNSMFQSQYGPPGQTLSSVIEDERGRMVSPIPGDYDDRSQNHTDRHNASGGFQPVGMRNQNEINLRNTMYNSVDINQQSSVSHGFSPNNNPSKQDASSPNKGSTMIELELKAIEKIKNKQKKEVEQMIDLEMRMNAIKVKNEHKALQDQAKVLRRAAELRRKMQIAENKKERDEIARQEKAAVEAELAKQRMEELQRRELVVIQKQKLLQQQREKEKKEKEEFLERKMFELKMEQDRKAKEQMRETQIRREELQRRDVQREMFRAAQNRARQTQSLKKRKEKEIKIQAAREQAEEAIQKQREYYQQKGLAAAQKLKEFEYQRSQERVEIKVKSEQKAQQMKRIFYECQSIEQQKKDTMLEARVEAEKRQKVLMQIQVRKIEHKKQQNAEKSVYQAEVVQTMYRKEKIKTKSLVQKRNDKEVLMSQTQTQREWEQFVKKEMDMMKREERLENVARIARANENTQHKIMLKIQADKVKADRIVREKNEMFENRMAVRKKADEEKIVLMSKVEGMKKKGNFDLDELSKMGINLKPQMFLDQTSQSTIGMNLDDIDKKSHNRSKSGFEVQSRKNMQKSQKVQMDKTIMNEINRKKIREQNIDIIKVDDPEAAKNMNIQNKEDTEEGNQKINNLQKEHEQELEQYDNQTLGADTQRDLEKMNNQQPNLLKIQEARNENESQSISGSKLEQVRASKASAGYSDDDFEE